MYVSMQRSEPLFILRKERKESFYKPPGSSSDYHQGALFDYDKTRAEPHSLFICKQLAFLTIMLFCLLGEQLGSGTNL